eukprot:6565185-Pyramimonas_sp.AAC.1
MGQRQGRGLADCRLVRRISSNSCGWQPAFCLFSSLPTSLASSALSLARGSGSAVRDALLELMMPTLPSLVMSSWAALLSCWAPPPTSFA